MAEFPAMPLWTDAYLSDTGHLSTVEHGAYLLLLLTMWRAGGELPDDDIKLSRYTKMTMAKWLKIKPSIMEFFIRANGVLSQKRLQKEFQFVKKNRQKQSQNAKAKWLKSKETGDAVANSGIGLAYAPTPTPTPTISPSLRSGDTRARKKAIRMPDDFTPDVDFAIAEGLTRDQAEREAKAIRDWSKSSPNGAKLDWPATWRGWIRRKVGDTAQKPDTTLKALDRMIDNERPNIFDALKTIDHEAERAANPASPVRLASYAQRY